MKILIVGKSPPIQGGASNCTYGTAVDLVSAGHDVDLLTDAQEVEASMRLYGGDHHPSIEPTKLPRLFSPSPIGNFEHFPKSTLRTERLIGKALELLNKKKYDLIVGWYLMPYGFVAYTASVATCTPYALVHGGSDIMTLAEHADIYYLTKLILARAAFIITASNELVQKRLLEIGGQHLKLRPIARGLPLASCHRLDSHLAFCETDLENIFEHYCEVVDDHELLTKFQATCKWVDSAGPTVILYGKASTGKRTFSTIKSLALLAEQGLEFRFICLLSGSKSNVLGALKLFEENPSLLNQSIVMPGVHPAIVPRLLKSCDIGLCLEECFGVPNHLSIVPREMMNAGIACITSKSLLSQPFYKWILRDKLNVIATEVGDFQGAAKSLISSKELIGTFKNASSATTGFIEEELSKGNPIADALTFDLC